jgi:hypothetical protein
MAGHPLWGHPPCSSGAANGRQRKTNPMRPTRHLWRGFLLRGHGGSPARPAPWPPDRQDLPIAILAPRTPRRAWACSVRTVWRRRRWRPTAPSPSRGRSQACAPIPAATGNATWTPGSARWSLKSPSCGRAATTRTGGGLGIQSLSKSRPVCGRVAGCAGGQVPGGRPHRQCRLRGRHRGQRRRLPRDPRPGVLTSEDGAGRTSFLRDLAARGLPGWSW